MNRDGYTTNLYDGSDIDTRDLYALRGSLRFEPGPDTTIDLMGYYFREKDTRLRNQKQTCQRDPLGVLGCLNNRRDFDTTNANSTVCLLYTSDAADERSSVDLGGRRIINKKKRIDMITVRVTKKSTENSHKKTESEKYRKKNSNTY